MKLLLAHGMFLALSTYFLERPIIQQNCLNLTKLCDYQVMLSGACFIRLCLPCYLQKSRVLVFRVDFSNINFMVLSVPFIFNAAVIYM